MVVGIMLSDHDYTQRRRIRLFQTAQPRSAPPVRESSAAEEQKQQNDDE
jgi:hypothetical protein